jgi:P pilus assembly chaperone PapD
MKILAFLILSLSVCASMASINAERTQKTVEYEYSSTHSKHVFYSLNKKSNQCLMTTYIYSEADGSASKNKIVDASNCKGLRKI